MCGRFAGRTGRLLAAAAVIAGLAAGAGTISAGAGSAEVSVAQRSADGAKHDFTAQRSEVNGV